MFFYVEEKLKDSLLLIKNLNRYKNAKIFYINNYKNILDKKMPFSNNQDIIIFAENKSKNLFEAPKWYGHEDFSYIFKNSLNCIFDCRYCFLKWAFKNSFKVFFLNYDNMKQDIIEAVSNFKENYKLWFYSSDYSDNLAMNLFSWFLNEFVPFFEYLNGAMLEIRTKSWNIKDILDLWFVPKNTEFAFSLNPQEIIEKYEIWTFDLQSRIKAINNLLQNGYKVWLRFLPLLPVKNYKNIYWKFVDYIKNNINMDEINSCFVSWILFTKDDYKTFLKKDPYFDLLYYLRQENDWFVRTDKKFREYLYGLFKDLYNDCKICLE